MKLPKFSLFQRPNGHLTAQERELRELVPYDPEKQYAVIRSSICTGEKVAGFKSRGDGRFREVMYLRTPHDEQRFREIYDLQEVVTEY